MRITRREFLKYCTISASALGLSATQLSKLRDALAKEDTPGTNDKLDIIWLHGASCSGDSTSLLNTMFYMDPVAAFVTDDLDLEFHQTIMNASGTDLAGATDALVTQAQPHLLGASGAASIAEWSTDVKADGTESIKLRVADRGHDGWYAEAIITPVSPIYVNDFTIYFKYKTSNPQEPYVEIDTLNPDTGAPATIQSHYPGVGGPVFPGGGFVMAPTDWTHVTMLDLPIWKVLPGTLPPINLPAPLPGPGMGDYVSWATIKDTYPANLVTQVRIVNGANAAVYGAAPNDPCTIYIDEIKVSGVAYPDESPAITFAVMPTGGAGVDQPFVLAIEGSILTATPAGGTLAGEFCEVGPMVTPGDPNETMLHAFLEYAKSAVAVLAIGTCASYGGIPAARGSVTGAMGCSAVLKKNGIRTPVINLPGCPAHPDWIIGTIAQVLAGGLGAVELDSKGRPRDYYPHWVCNGNIDVKCPWIYNNDRYDTDADLNGIQESCAAAGVGACPDGTADDPANSLGQSRGLAKYKWGSIPAGSSETYRQSVGNVVTYTAGHTFEGCLGVLGCRGRKTKADCAYRKWNTNVQFSVGVNWCVGSRGGCQGCTDPKFPSNSRFYTFR